MKQLAVLTLLVICGVMAWLFASRLSADALGMAVGLVFGVLAGVPTALLVLAVKFCLLGVLWWAFVRDAPPPPGAAGVAQSLLHADRTARPASAETTP